MTEANPIRSEGPGGPSDRVRLGAAARDAALRVPGVVTTDAGPTGLYVTASGDQRIEGIICAAANDGGYDLSVRLIAGLVSLPHLSDQVIAAVRGAAARVGVPCSSVSIYFADLRVGGEV